MIHLLSCDTSISSMFLYAQASPTLTHMAFFSSAAATARSCCSCCTVALWVRSRSCSSSQHRRTCKVQERGARHNVIVAVRVLSRYGAK